MDRKCLFSRKVVLVFLLVVLACLITNGDASRVRRRQNCPKNSRRCLLTQLGLTARHSCKRDADCGPGLRCCFHGCERSCQLWNPCDTVVCNAGFTCRLRHSFLYPQQKWVPEADCVADETTLCPNLTCASQPCLPGFRRRLDVNGCPTCYCDPKQECKESCRMLCPYGQETGPDGCPVCACKMAPENPCSSLNCTSQQECRLVVPSDCASQPCNPRPQCVRRAKTPALFNNACVRWDPSTVHLPVVSRACSSSAVRVPDGGRDWCELDCTRHPCPDRTVCVRMGLVQSRCCWQGTQALLLPPSKAGECPPDVLINAASSPLSEPQRRQSLQRCQLDAQCPGQQKCCSSSSSSNNIRGQQQLQQLSTSVYGYCTDPTHKILDDLVAATLTPS